MGSGTQLVGGDTVIITPTITVDTGAYAALDIIGGQITLSNVFRKDYGSAILQSITVIDDDNEKAGFDIVFFDADPAGTTTDNGAWTHAAADPAKILGRVTVAASDYVTVVTGSLAIATIRNIGLPVRNNEDTKTLYALLIATATPTFTAATNLTIRFGFLRD